ncbi:hypothetical protein D3C75_924490 [compost metagenome]
MLAAEKIFAQSVARIQKTEPDTVIIIGRRIACEKNKIGNPFMDHMGIGNIEPSQKDDTIEIGILAHFLRPLQAGLAGLVNIFAVIIRSRLLQGLFHSLIHGAEVIDIMDVRVLMKQQDAGMPPFCIPAVAQLPRLFPDLALQFLADSGLAGQRPADGYG